MTPNTDKMHAARRAARDEEIWSAVERAIQRERCHCGLRKGMTRDELPFGSGCKGQSYVCPALDTYRRLLPPAPLPEDERKLQEEAA